MAKSKKEKSEKEMKKNMKSTEIPINDTNSNDTNEESIIDELQEADTSAEDSANENSSKLEEQVSSLRDQLLRKSAEFENYKRRTDAEKADYFTYANEKLIKELLPVLDDFSRALKAYDESHDSESLKKGVELVNDRLNNALAKHGLKEIDSNGKDFDVDLHEALLQQPAENTEPNKVLDTIEKGYKLGDKVIRHAKVIVSN